MAKINVSLPEELLHRIDEEAEVLGMSRSGLIQEASARYVAEASADREAEARRLRVKSAAARMKAIGKRVGLEGPVDTADLVRAARAEEQSRHGT